MPVAKIYLTFTSGNEDIHLCRSDFEYYYQAVEWYNAVMRNFSISRLLSVSFSFDF